MVGLAPHGEFAKSLPVGELATQKLLVSVDDVVGLELLSTTLADKYMATVLPNFVLAMCWQRLKSLVTDITAVNPLSLLLFVPHTDPIQQQQKFPLKPSLDTPLHVLPKSDPCLEGDVADGKTDPSACHQFVKVSVLQYFQGTARSMDIQFVWTAWTFLRSSSHSGCIVLSNRAGWQVTGDLVPQEATHNSYCWVFVYL